MNKISCKGIYTLLLISCSLPIYSQLVGSNAQLWEKSNKTIRDNTRCKDENLLNFHCGIKDKLLKKYIKYNKNSRHTLSLVHLSNEDELIWDKPDQNISLSNNVYTKEKNQKKLIKHPSIFSYMGMPDPLNKKADSLKIKFADQNLYEIIFFNKKINTTDLGKIHTYLSIKYGISLENGKYYGSDGKVLWDPERHKEFKFRPTGLGRDDGNELYQKQSSNQSDSFLAIGMNSINRTNFENSAIIEDNNFVIWSDDNKEMMFKTNNGFNILERNWEINFIGNKISKTDYWVRISKKNINPGSDPLTYWMLLTNDNGDVKKIQGFEKDNYIVFDKVDFLDAFDSGNSANFTFATSYKGQKESENWPRSNSGSQYNTDDLSLDLNMINLYPNPVKKDQNFTIVFPKMENLIISIYDGGGRLIKLEKISKDVKSYTGYLSIQSSYLINLTHNGKIIKTFKLIVD